MKILYIMVDMLRGDLSSYINPNRTKSPFDYLFDDLGGTFYTNAFTPAPDTGRSTAALFTGSPPHVNGCLKFGDYPYYSLNPNLTTIFDICEQNNMTINTFGLPHEYYNSGVFPKRFAHSLDNLSHDVSIQSFCNNLTIEENSFTFIDIQALHSVLDDLGYNQANLIHAQQKALDCITIFFNQFSPDLFDHIFIFSDHGFKLDSDDHSSYLSLNTDRTHITLFHCKKQDTKLTLNHNLFSIEDIYWTTCHILDSTSIPNTGGKLLSDKLGRNYIITEDHTPTNGSLWAIIQKNTIYIRSESIGLKLNRKTQALSYNIDQYNDTILIKNSSFKHCWLPISRYFTDCPYSIMPLIGDESTYQDNTLRKRNPINSVFITQRLLHHLNNDLTHQDYIFFFELNKKFNTIHAFRNQSKQVQACVIEFLTHFERWLLNLSHTIELEFKDTTDSGKKAQLKISNLFYNHCLNASSFNKEANRLYKKSTLCASFGFTSFLKKITTF